MHKNRKIILWNFVHYNDARKTFREPAPEASIQKQKASAPWHWLSLLYTYPQPERWGPFMAEVYSRRKDMVISVSSRLP